MNLDQFDYELPEELIAQFPLSERTASRLLHFEAFKNQFADLNFIDLHQLLHEGDLLVLNDTKVVPARLFGTKSSGGKVEFLLERMIDTKSALAQLKASKSPKSGTKIFFTNNVVAEVKGRQEDFYVVQFSNEFELENLLAEHGLIPLPPYIQRIPEQVDVKRYQTVYANTKGAVAAPTAGLHFDKPMLNKIQQQGIDLAFITLHVGAGTFQPVRINKIEEHSIHAERVQVSQEVCDKVNACKQKNGRVIAVGTTVVRALESAVIKNSLQPYQGNTALFIYPGYKFKIVDDLITNFHLPKSTLLMLVCAFAGYETTMSAYQHAVNHNYRFYSYGDAMFIEKRK